MAQSPSSSSSLEKKIAELSVKDRSKTKADNFPPLEVWGINSGFLHTKSLIEMFQVRIDKFDDIERRGELYGKIWVVDSEGTQTLYNRDRANLEHIRANHTISLTGPPCSISLIVGFAVNIELYLRDDGGGSDSSQDMVLSKWQLSWIL